MVLEDSPQWDTGREYTVDNVETYMEIEKESDRGLIKIGKAMTMAKWLKGRIVHDGVVRIFVVPKSKASQWIAEWKKTNTRSM